MAGADSAGSLRVLADCVDEFEPTSDALALVRAQRVATPDIAPVRRLAQAV